MECMYTKESADKHESILLSHVMSQIRGGNLLDIGSGLQGLRWLLLYIQKVSSVTLTDCNLKVIHSLSSVLNGLDPENIEEMFGDYIEALRKLGYFSRDTDYHSLATLIHKKEIKALFYDFTGDVTRSHPEPGKSYDTVISCEAIECVDTLEELQKAVSNVYMLLRSGGVFAGITYKYEVRNEYVEALIEKKEEGKLNPDTDTLKCIFNDTGFQNVKMHEFITTVQHYSKAITFSMNKI
jgi:hypothetical protein